MNSLTFKPIGIIHSPFKEKSKTPRYPRSAKNVRGEVEIYPEYIAGLKDLEGFSHIVLIFNFHLNEGYELIVTPYLDKKKHGLFSTRSPYRPNPIGVSVVKLIEIKNNILIIEEFDMMDGTPLLDIKPYTLELIDESDVKIGWIEKYKDIFYNNK